MAHFDVAILGAGPVGLAIAKRMADSGKSVAIFERQGTIGGLFAGNTFEGRTFDIGAFWFTSQDPLFSAFPDILPDFVPNPRNLKVRLPNNKVIDWPPSPTKVANGIRAKIRVFSSLAASKLRYFNRMSVRDYCCYYSGEYYFQNYGLKRYVENLFATPIDEIELEIAKERLIFLENFGVRKFARGKIRIALGSHRRTASDKPAAPKIASLARPAYGLSELFTRIAKTLTESGVSIFLASAIDQISKSGAGWKIFNTTETHFAGELVSTIPIDEICRMVGLPMEGALETSSLLSGHFVGRLPDNIYVIYNFSDNGRWKRLTNFRVLYGAEEDSLAWFTTESILEKDGDAETILADVKSDLEASFGPIKLIGRTVTKDAYPKARHGSTKVKRAHMEALRAMGIKLAGRQGTYRYSNASVATNAFLKS